MKKLYTSKTFLKMAGGRCIPLILPSLDTPLAISYTNHQKSLACFSHLASLGLFFFLLKGRVKKGRGHGTMVSL